MRMWLPAASSRPSFQPRARLLTALDVFHDYRPTPITPQPLVGLPSGILRVFRARLHAHSWLAYAARRKRISQIGRDGQRRTGQVGR
jgi:hypothetical protein